MLTVGQECPPLIDIIDSDWVSGIRAMTFTANGECVVGGGGGQVGVWRMEDGKRMATMVAPDVRSLAVSKDGRWIAAGTYSGYVFVWDAKTFGKVFFAKPFRQLLGVDFSPDSTRLVTASTPSSVWDVAARKQVLTLDHEGWVIAAKYSLQGNRIATATRESIRVWDSNDGRVLVDIPVKVTPLFNNGLLWSDNHLLVVSDSTIKEFEASTGSTVSEWSVPNTDDTSCIALQQHGGTIACSTNNTVAFWDTSTHARLGLIQHPQVIYSIALSPDDRFLVIGGNSGKITIRSLYRITVSIVCFWIMADLNNFLVRSSFQTAFNPVVLSTSHFPGT